MRAKNKVKWYPFFSRGQHPILMNDFIWRSFAFFPNILKLPRINYYRRDSTTYLDKREYFNLLHSIRKQLLKDPKTSLNRINTAFKNLASLAQLAQRYKKIDWQKSSNQKTLSEAKRLFRLMIRTFVYIYWPLWVADEASHLITLEFKKRFPQDWQKQLEKATTIHGLTQGQKFRRLLEKTARRYLVQKNKRTWLTIQSKKLAQRYGYLRSYFFRIAPYLHQELAKEILILSEGLKNNFPAIKKGNFNTRLLSQRTVQLVKIIQKAKLLREERIGIWSKTILECFPLLKRVSQIYNLSYNQFIQLTYQEFLSGKFNKASLHRRSGGYRFSVIKNQLKVTPYKFMTKAFLAKNLIIGMVANQGKVKGRVKIADTYSFHTIEKGVILVTSMTTPDAVPYLKKVKAIVTDEGGITAHAAIVSRELGIPCIIGTKIATKVLKDGDLVEVDANKGVVRIIK